MKKAIVYYRVSTTKQGVSGLGIEAQEATVLSFCHNNNYQVTKEFTEIDSGGNNKRSILKQALTEARLRNATLIVAKLDRISRDALFIEELKRSGVDFICADMPEANSTILSFMAAFAEYERKMASERTKAALQAKKKREIDSGNTSFKLGNSKALEDHRNTDTTNANKARKAKALERNRMVFEIIEDIRKSGITSNLGIAKELNNRKYQTIRGNKFSDVAVRKIIESIKEEVQTDLFD